MSAYDGNGHADIFRIYFLVDTAPSTSAGGCHGFYDRASNGIYLYNDALTAVTGPIIPGAAGTIQNGQCAIDGAASSVTASGIDVVLNLNITRHGAYASGAKTLYFWVKDSANNDTGWIVGSNWVLNVSSLVAPTVAGVSPTTATATAQTFTVTGRDGNGYADINRVYFLVNTAPSVPPGS
jgi:hypothetical protein